ncbi:unnamed protein product [Adineta ricciae]|uniref:Carrier domain-containing protein n=1 Tax=Adineta ricciae TaxID=249248 RepID=A0A814CJ40_ADIRI|nr:unnamed protein product [Adineta ricciae]
MVGGVYCPLSPRDPLDRLNILFETTESRLLLVHEETKLRIGNGVASFDIDTIFRMTIGQGSVGIDALSTMVVNSDKIAYVVFTSGSTGIPKGVRVRHRNVVACIKSLVQVNLFTKDDTVLQMASCSYDVHVQEILGALIVGCTSVMLHPHGNMDLDYVVTVVKGKQVSYMQSVPAYVGNLLNLLEQKNQNALPALRTLDIGGDNSTIQFMQKLRNCVANNVCIWNTYGPAECTIDCTGHVVNITPEIDGVSIGRPLPTYRAIVLDDMLQPVINGAEGELFIGGAGVFAGYLNRDDLTSSVLLSIDNEAYYRTGDLVRIDSKGLLYYVGRKDFQVKLHGQRIELGEIERCLLDTTITACVVTKWGEHHLVAYVQSSETSETQLREHCQSHLPSHMVPSMFIILDKLPLNANGKVDRKQLPSPEFSMLKQADSTAIAPLTPLELQLRSIFSRAFHNELPNVTMSFGEMGGTSLDVIRALYFLRQEITTKIDVGLVFANPSIRQLACAIQPLIDTSDTSVAISTIEQSTDSPDRSISCLIIELLGIVLLLSQWLFPMWLAFQFHSFVTLLSVPVFHLVAYIVCLRLLVHSSEVIDRKDKLYSWYYYRWWFLNSLWSINNSYWLRHLTDTPFYNWYLRLCGAKVGRNAHIYTVSIDAPWLIEVGDSTFIGDEVVLSSLSYEEKTYTLRSISIGSHCCINTRSTLYYGATIENNTYIEPMSAVSGVARTTNNDVFLKNQGISLKKSIHQFVCLFLLLIIHSSIILLSYYIYCGCRILPIPLPVCIAFSWLIWASISFCTAIVLLKFIVGRAKTGCYSLNSFHYVQKIWLRQLIITSFQHSLDLLPNYSSFASVILRWLGTRIEEDVMFAHFRHILYFPSDLLEAKSTVTTFGGAKLATFDVTKYGFCRLDKIHLGAGTNLTNWCTVMPGARLASNTMVGSLTLVTQETSSINANTTLLGIPAREMPFKLSDDANSTQNRLSSTNTFSIKAILLSCLRALVSKSLLVILYSSLPVFASPVVHIILSCAIYRYSIWLSKKQSQSTYSIIITTLQQIFNTCLYDFYNLIAPFLSGTQYLVYVFRGLGARIGRDVILPDIKCLIDPYLTTIGNHVRLQTGAYIECHTSEHRRSKRAPVTVNHSSVLMSNTLILPGTESADILSTHQTLSSQIPIQCEHSTFDHCIPSLARYCITKTDHRNCSRKMKTLLFMQDIGS